MGLIQSLKRQEENDFEFKMRACKLYGLSSCFNTFGIGMVSANLYMTNKTLKQKYVFSAMAVSSICFGYWVYIRCQNNMQDFHRRIEQLSLQINESNPGYSNEANLALKN